MKLLGDRTLFEIPTTIEIEDGTYPAALEKVETYRHEVYGEGRKWHWLVEHDGKIDPLSSITSGNTGPRSKTYQYLSAFEGRAPKAGEKIADPTGKRVLLQITHNDKGFPQVAAVLPYVNPQQELPGLPR